MGEATIFDLLKDTGVIDDAELEEFSPIIETEPYIDKVLEAFKEAALKVQVHALHYVNEGFYFLLDDICEIFNLTETRVRQFLKEEQAETELVEFENYVHKGYDTLCLASMRTTILGVQHIKYESHKYITTGGIRAILSQIIRMTFMNDSKQDTIS